MNVKAAIKSVPYLLRLVLLAVFVMLRCRCERVLDPSGPRHASIEFSTQ